jgi:hypothetical protein
VENCRFVYNHGTSYGGGIYVVSATPSITNCVIAFNSGSYGGGVYVYTGGATTRILNCTFYGNVATYYNGALRSYNSSVDVDNSIFWGDTEGPYPTYHKEIGFSGGTFYVDYCDVETGWATGTGNKNADPLFTEPAALNFRIPAWSQCTNTALSSAAPFVDIELNPRRVPDNYSADIGAYEYQVTWP